MTDNFALLNEPRRPWLDLDSLKEKFLALSTQTHPDRVHQSPEPERIAASARFAELNSAYQCLREPKERLRHLLELERGAKPADIQRVPENLMTAMFEIGQLCKQVDAFLLEYSRVTSPILKVPWFERAQNWVAQLSLRQQKIHSQREELLLELKAMNSAWETATASANRPLDRVEEMYRVLGYLTRWSEQIQERVVRLSL
ncbi:MAG TPA: DnaJ domain-containing protein [Verrucomicrobiae bacterium]|jgi:DnaJ-domain-containing protein 1|nr:DnaJ domain-containing protein [Verrucomicrobiae bacterium]